MRIVFAGTPDFADVALEALLIKGFEVVAVFTQPDRPAGRGMKLKPSPVKLRAQSAGIPLFQPISLRLDGKYPDDALAAQAALQALQPDVMVVAAYGLILPQWTLDLPRAGCINIHGSLLPRWRGAAPVQRAIEAGDSHSGVCLMQMAAGLDTGDVFAQATVAITDTMTGDELHDALAQLGARLLCEQLPAIVQGASEAIPQSEQGITYASKLQRTDGLLDWGKSASALARQVRAFDSVVGCYFHQGDAVYKVWAAQALERAEDSIYVSGTIVDLSRAGLDIACAQGLLRVTEIQKPGGKRLPISACWQQLATTLAVKQQLM